MIKDYDGITTSRGGGKVGQLFKNNIELHKLFFCRPCGMEVTGLKLLIFHLVFLHLYKT